MKLNLETPEALFLSFLAAALLLVIKHSSDVRRELETKRREAYSELLSALSSHLTISTDGSMTRLNVARANAFLLASDDVARLMGDFFKSAFDVQQDEIKANSVDPDKMLRSYAQMVLLMRKDSGEKSKLTIQQAIDAMPIRYSKK